MVLSYDAENLLWSRLRRRQLCDIQFYRQKPIGNFIVDFYAPKALLVIEVDGGQHYEEIHVQQDQMRDAYLKNQNLKVLRFNNMEVISKYKKSPSSLTLVDPFFKGVICK